MQSFSFFFLQIRISKTELLTMKCSEQRRTEVYFLKFAQLYKPKLVS